MKTRQTKRNFLALRNTIILTATVMAVTSLSDPYDAAANAVPIAVQKACQYDYKRLCRHYKPGTPEMHSCMQASVGQLSPRCYNTLIRYGYGKRDRRSSLR